MKWEYLIASVAVLIIGVHCRPNGDSHTKPESTGANAKPTNIEITKEYLAHVPVVASRSNINSPTVDSAKSNVEQIESGAAAIVSRRYIKKLHANDTGKSGIYDNNYILSNFLKTSISDLKIENTKPPPLLPTNNKPHDTNYYSNINTKPTNPTKITTSTEVTVLSNPTLFISFEDTTTTTTTANKSNGYQVIEESDSIEVNDYDEYHKKIIGTPLLTRIKYKTNEAHRNKEPTDKVIFPETKNSVYNPHHESFQYQSHYDHWRPPQTVKRNPMESNIPSDVWFHDDKLEQFATSVQDSFDNVDNYRPVYVHQSVRPGTHQIQQQYIVPNGYPKPNNSPQFEQISIQNNYRPPPQVLNQFAHKPYSTTPAPTVVITTRPLVYTNPFIGATDTNYPSLIQDFSSHYYHRPTPTAPSKNTIVQNIKISKVSTPKPQIYETSYEAQKPPNKSPENQSNAQIDADVYDEVEEEPVTKPSKHTTVKKRKGNPTRRTTRKPINTSQKHKPQLPPNTSDPDDPDPVYDEPDENAAFEDTQSGYEQIDHIVNDKLLTPEKCINFRIHGGNQSNGPDGCSDFNIIIQNNYPPPPPAPTAITEVPRIPVLIEEATKVNSIGLGQFQTDFGVTSKSPSFTISTGSVEEEKAKKKKKRKRKKRRKKKKKQGHKDKDKYDEHSKPVHIHLEPNKVEKKPIKIEIPTTPKPVFKPSLFDFFEEFYVNLKFYMKPFLKILPILAILNPFSMGALTLIMSPIALVILGGAGFSMFLAPLLSARIFNTGARNVVVHEHPGRRRHRRPPLWRRGDYYPSPYPPYDYQYPSYSHSYSTRSPYIYPTQPTSNYNRYNVNNNYRLQQRIGTPNDIGTPNQPSIRHRNIFDYIREFEATQQKN